MTVTGDEWLTKLAAALGIPRPSPSEVEDLLALAGVAAHSSERTAAPLSTWLAGRSGLGVAEVRRLAEQLASELGPEGLGSPRDQASSGPVA